MQGWRGVVRGAAPDDLRPARSAPSSPSSIPRTRPPRPRRNVNRLLKFSLMGMVPRRGRARAHNRCGRLAWWSHRQGVRRCLPLEVAVYVSTVSDLEYFDRYAVAVDRAEHAIRPGTPTPTVLHSLEFLRVGEHAGVLASVKALDQFRYQQKGFAIEALQLLYRSARQLYRIAQSNRQTEIGLDLAPGNARTVVFLDRLRRSRASSSSSRRSSVRTTHLRKTWNRSSRRMRPIHSFSFGSNRIADTVMAASAIL